MMLYSAVGVSRLSSLICSSASLRRRRRPTILFWEFIKKEMKKNEQNSGKN
ncbi:MAG: hypothetical protein WBG73_05975 [Coleofasciculaceae cyanobacterium]